MVTGKQIRAARYLVALSVEHLAHASGVAAATVRAAEESAVTAETPTADLEAMQRVLEAQGVEFMDDGTGVRLSCGR